MENEFWRNLYDEAVANCNERKISDSVFVGSVSAVIFTEKGNIYGGVSIDTACSMGYCAERNAIGSMLTAGESAINKLVAVRNKEILMPCGVCREFLMQLGKKNRETEILVSLSPLRVVKLGELLPYYWNK